VALHKQWVWLGAFGPDAMLCVARARVGFARTAWWVVWDGRRLRTGRRVAAVSPAGARAEGLELAFAPGRAIEATTGPAWTRKTPGRVTGVLDGRPFAAAALLDESAGRHPRRTAWLWSAGAGVAASGAAVAWNLVAGMHPGENAVWVDGEPHLVDPPRFDGLRAVAGLTFRAEATHARRENRLVIASDYEQPFGTFAGELPVAGRLREGWGVMERHEARW
jgi:Protein of unknown function (DUF2804)